MKLDRIEIFCAVARNMSFTKAAEECNMAQSAISMQIRALEEELGFPLFERSTRKVSFTDAGQSFYVDCVKLLSGFDEALDRAVSTHKGKKMFLTIGIEGLMQTSYKAATIRRFIAEHPDIQIIPHQVERDKKYEELNNGEIDLVFDLPQYFVLNAKICKAGAIVNEHCLMVHREHPLADKKTVSKKELAEHITFWGGIPKVEDYVTKLYLDYFRESGIEPENVIYVPEQDVATFMVAANMGGNIVPISEKEQMNRDNFRFVELQEPLVFESAWLYSSKNQNPALPLFLKTAEEMAAEYTLSANSKPDSNQ